MAEQHRAVAPPAGGVFSVGAQVKEMREAQAARTSRSAAAWVATCPPVHDSGRLTGTSRSLAGPSDKGTQVQP